VRLSQIGTSAINWPIVPAPDGRLWAWSSHWNENWQRKQKYSEKICPSATLSTTNPTWHDKGSSPGHQCGKPAINRLSYGTTPRKSNYSRFSDRWLVLGCTESDAKRSPTPINIKLPFLEHTPFKWPRHDLVTAAYAREKRPISNSREYVTAEKLVMEYKV
jgi:hypothetical protein